MIIDRARATALPIPAPTAEDIPGLVECWLRLVFEEPSGEDRSVDT